MQSIYHKLELKKPGFFQKLFNNFPDDNAVFELNNLLATKPVMEISIDEVIAISKKYEVDLYGKYLKQLKSLYITYLKSSLEDKSLSDTEIEELRHLKALLSLTDNDIKQIHNSISYDLYKQTMYEAIKDIKIDESERVILENLQKQLLIPKETIDKIFSEAKELIVNTVFETFTKDERLSKEEEKQFYELCNSFGIDINADKPTKALLEKYKLYWIIENAELPPLSVDINLQKNESCFYKIDANWYETKTVTKSIRYGGPAVSFRIVKGVYYRAGNYNLKKQTAEENVLIDNGQLYITNKRIIFIGSKRSTNIRLGRVLSITPYSNGIEITKDSGTNPIFVVKYNADILAMMISRVVGDISS